MIGSNTLVFNQATMIAAMQHYLSTVLFAEGKAPTVKAVKFTGQNGAYDERDLFHISVMTEECKGPN
jgi:hypothetical protein